MPIAEIERRLERMAELQRTDTELLIRIETRLNAINGDLTAMKAELGGAPDLPARGPRGTVRSRLHELEKSDWAQTLLLEARSANVAATKAAWSRWEKGALFLVATGGFAIAVLRFAGFGG